jgi:glycosyltransferase involved in cell wall biosynthesis
LPQGKVADEQAIKGIMPRVSIITPCFNAGRYIGRMIESLRAQTFTDWEQFIVDDGSQDDSAAVAEAYLACEPRLGLVRQGNRGVCNARNRGVSFCSPSAQYIYFLDADDCLEPEMLEVMVGYLDAHREVGLCFCDYCLVDEEDRPLPTPRLPRYVPGRFGVRELPPEEPRTPFASIYCWAPVMESLSVLRKSVYLRTPGWDESLGHHGEGVDLFLHVALMSEVHFVPRKLYRYRRHGAQNTADLDKQRIQEEKIVNKWVNKTALTPQQRSIVLAAEQFRRERLIPWLGVRAGTRCLRKADLSRAIAFYGGALRRYLGSSIPRVGR